MPSLSRLLALALEKRGWSQREFARRVGVSSAAITRILAGSSAPRMTRAIPWADALGLAGEERRAFILAVALANSPPLVRDLVAKQERELRRRAR